jgi:hypothetical protein
VKGLTEGTLNVQDIRKEAMRAREEYRKTAKSLGPDGEKALNQALGGWIDILDRFIRDSDPKVMKDTAPAAPGETDKRVPPAEAKQQEAPKVDAKEQPR